MPMTPLHLAAALPIRKHISMKAFIAVNVLIDLEVLMVVFFRMDEQGYDLHGGAHTLAGALVLGLIIWLVGWASGGDCKQWALGAIGGALSHVFMDALVHTDVAPLWPLVDGNPLYAGIHLELSILCAVVLAYYLAQWVKSLRVGEMLARRLK